MKRIWNVLIGLFFIAIMSVGFAAPEKSYWNQWVPFDPLSKQTIDYPTWKSFLTKYTTTKNGQVYIQYANVSGQDKQSLDQAIQKLSHTNLDQYNRQEQLAFWINLYNMETVYLVLQNYPVSSITKIKDGYFSFGPWDKKVLKVDGVELTLNDIEHRIIRPIWNDPRIHAAVNCASISCPNLLTVPFNANQIDTQLNDSFSAFVNSPKGVQIQGKTLVLSEIFKWYGVDFGDNEQDIKNFISYYLTSNIQKEKLLATSNVQYQEYNWNLNGIK